MLSDPDNIPIHILELLRGQPSYACNESLTKLLMIAAHHPSSRSCFGVRRLDAALDPNIQSGVQLPHSKGYLAFSSIVGTFVMPPALMWIGSPALPRKAMAKPDRIEISSTWSRSPRASAPM